MRQDFESKANFGWRREVEEVEEENLNHFEDFDLGSAQDSSEKSGKQSNWNTELQ